MGVCQLGLFSKTRTRYIHRPTSVSGHDPVLYIVGCARRDHTVYLTSWHPAPWFLAAAAAVATGVSVSYPRRSEMRDGAKQPPVG